MAVRGKLQRMNRLVELQVRRNAAGRDAWDCAARHRQRVTALLCEAAPSVGGRLCVLGAGNCNDLELPDLARRFAEVHLVDVDGEALAAAVARQGPLETDAVHLHGGCDLTGIWQQLAGWSAGASGRIGNPSHEEVRAAIDAAKAFVSELPGPFDVAASVCLLSQLIEGIVASLGERHPAFLDLLQAVRRRHLQLLADATARGGTGLLITDIVSTDSAPGLASVPEVQLEPALMALVNAGNLFHGLHPAVIANELQSDPRVRGVEILKPWVWDLGVRQYGVIALRFQRADK
jgi:hypothetical protein